MDGYPPNFDPLDARMNGHHRNFDALESGPGDHYCFYIKYKKNTKKVFEKKIRLKTEKKRKRSVFFPFRFFSVPFFFPAKTDGGCARPC